MVLGSWVVGRDHVGGEVVNDLVGNVLDLVDEDGSSQDFYMEWYLMCFTGAR
jgi:hypothetical protein